ncbi:hypothetical protein HNP46_000327 [Pseudomonas nitritireducens]|uniref:Uncharacterized protein n=1 Tax=Pseudomonas nitroreducens TaxID=46680 RepID=A0A7W7NYJ3_PSENT|nr:hypothetical protein [Pseudomonas nitritireducens]MBB4861516.1 hypothetical protein [Pseudomonas nitritireducens]
MSKNDIIPPRIKVLRKDHVVIGTVAARIGLRTYYGKIIKYTEKSIWVETKSRNVVMYRVMDNPPGVMISALTKQDEPTWFAGLEPK